MDFYTAKTQFNNYLKDYDCHNDKIRLKIVHTYGVVKESADIAARMKLSEEDTSLAKMIALLHDIGRFEQLKQFDSFLPDTMDHAAYGVKILFDNAPHQNLIRNFIPESDFDEIIRISIAKHSDFKLDGISDARTLLHAKIIRDADKLDNCRVKLEDRLETFMDTSAEETGASAISPKVRDSILRHECILSSDRVTPMDYWISYLAYFYDINFRESLDIIEEQNYIPKIIARIPYTNPETKEVMKTRGRRIDRVCPDRTYLFLSIILQYTIPASVLTVVATIPAPTIAAGFTLPY